MNKNTFLSLKEEFDKLVDEYGEIPTYSFYDFVIYWYAEESENKYSAKQFCLDEINEAFKNFN